MRKYTFFIVWCLLACSLYGESFAGYFNLPRDANGWTIFTPSGDSLIVYVSSSSGNDSTCAAYSSSSEAIGGDPFNPVSAVPCATFSTAYAKTRDNMPDWILFKRGDTFVGSIDTEVRSGRSATEPFLIGAYGSAGAAPIFKVPSNVYAFRPTGSKQWLALSGLNFYAYQRDPSSPDYIDGAGLEGIRAFANEANVLQDVLIEGCKFSFFTNNQISADIFGVNVFRFHLYRCIFAYNYSESTHSQGFLAGRVDGIILEENIFDHNGWLIQSVVYGDKTGGQATVYNHNIYMADNENITVKNNIFMRPSSMNNKFTADFADVGENILIENNLYIDGEGAISIGGNTATALRFKGVTIKDNVITSLNISHPTNRTLAYGIEVHDWDGGEIKNNAIINTNEANSFAFYFIGTSRNVSVHDNIVYDFEQVDNALKIVDDRGTNVSNMSFTDNEIQISANSGYTINSEYDPTGKWTFSGNKYFSSKTDGTRFTLLGANKTDAQWAAATGDNSTFEQVSFPDPTRSIETYMASLGEMATIDAFTAKARAQDRYNWDTRYTADAVNDYIRAGFGMGQRRLFRNVRLADPGE